MMKPGIAYFKIFWRKEWFSRVERALKDICQIKRTGEALDLNTTFTSSSLKASLIFCTCGTEVF